MQPGEHERREREWLEREVEAARHLTDQERTAILEDLWQTIEAIRATKTEDQLRREELAREQLDGEGLARYRALVERLQ